MPGTVLRTTTAVVGGDGLLSARVLDRLAGDALAVRPVDPHEPALARSLEGVETLVVVDRVGGGDLDGTGGSDLDLPAVREVLAAARRTGVAALVVVSSAMVYGAREDNPVPLTEDAAVRPAPGVPYAIACAELERLAAEFGDEDAARRVAVLRPAVVLGPASTEWLRRSAWGRRGVPADDTLAPRQFVHVDDVAEAVAHVCAERLEGVFNVAPDGWIAGDTFRELVGGVEAAVPSRARRVVGALRHAVGGAPVPAGLEPYTTAPWVVASDRLRSAGWEPRYSSEEVFVEADRARGWRALSPRSRQELSLGVVAALVAGAAVAGAALLRRRHRRQRG